MNLKEMNPLESSPMNGLHEHGNARLLYYNDSFHNFQESVGVDWDTGDPGDYGVKTDNLIYEYTTTVENIGFHVSIDVEVDVCNMDDSLGIFPISADVKIDNVKIEFLSDIPMVSSVVYFFEGNANDTGGAGLHGEVFGASLTQDRFGEANSAYRFDGIDDYIALPTNNFYYDKEGFTWAVWYKPEGNGGSLITAADTTGCEDFQMGIGEHPPNEPPVISDEAIWAVVDFVGGCSERYVVEYDLTQGIQSEKFYHVALRVNYSDGMADLFVDGTKVKTVPISGSINSRDMIMTIGAFRHTSENPSMLFNGVIDDVIIYKKILTDHEIKVLSDDSRISTSKLRGQVNTMVTGQTEPIIGAKISISKINSTVMSDAEGKFEIVEIQPGTYTLSIEKQGFAPIVKTDVVVQEGQEVQLPAIEMAFQKSSCDFSGDNTVGLKDAIHILKFISGSNDLGSNSPVVGAWTGNSSQDQTRLNFNVLENSTISATGVFDMGSVSGLQYHIIGLGNALIDSQKTFQFIGTSSFTPNPTKPWEKEQFAYSFEGVFVNDSSCDVDYAYTVRSTEYTGSFQAFPKE